MNAISRNTPQVPESAARPLRVITGEPRTGAATPERQRATFPRILFNPLAQQLLRLGKRREAAEAKLEKRLRNKPGRHIQ